MERGGSHPRRAADVIKVDNITDAPVTVVEYLVIEPWTEAGHDGPMSAKCCTSTSNVAGVVVGGGGAASDGTCTRYL